MTSTIKNSNDQTRKLTKAILSVQSPYLKKNKKKLYSEEKIAEKDNNPKELWQIPKSRGMLSKGEEAI